MPEDGNHIYLDAKPGSEKIQIKDQYGNKVILNAAEKRIELKSPTHNTKLELGNTTKGANYGVYIYSDAEYYLDVSKKYYKKIKGHSETEVDGHYRTTVVGHYRTMVGGYYTTLVGGTYTTVAGGLYTNVALVGKSEVCLGAKTQVTAGFKLVIDEGYKYTIGKMEEVNEVPKWETITRDLARIKSAVITLEGEVGLNARGQCISLNDGVMKVKK